MSVNECTFIMTGCHSSFEIKQETSFSRVIALHRFGTSSHDFLFFSLFLSFFLNVFFSFLLFVFPSICSFLKVFQCCFSFFLSLKTFFFFLSLFFFYLFFSLSIFSVSCFFSFFPFCIFGLFVFSIFEISQWSLLHSMSKSVPQSISSLLFAQHVYSLDEHLLHSSVRHSRLDIISQV